jgi:hypothetical protein
MEARSRNLRADRKGRGDAIRHYMSYDVEIWSVRPFERQMFREPDRWEQPGAGQLIFPGVRWQIAVYASDQVVPEDVPAAISSLLPGVEYLTRMHLEGKATREATKLLNSTALQIAEGCRGVILDPQEGMTRIPGGIKRFMPPEKEETFSVLEMSWWFLDGPLCGRPGRESFLSLLERLLPEAMPKRYGEYEPPQHVYAKTGKEHLLQFLDEPHLGFVWYPHRPVTSVHLALAKTVGATYMGFRKSALRRPL